LSRSYPVSLPAAYQTARTFRLIAPVESELGSRGRHYSSADAGPHSKGSHYRFEVRYIAAKLVYRAEKHIEKLALDGLMVIQGCRFGLIVCTEGLLCNFGHGG
jgi:hypothetical protein